MSVVSTIYVHVHVLGLADLFIFTVFYWHKKIIKFFKVCLSSSTSPFLTPMTDHGISRRVPIRPTIRLQGAHGTFPLKFHSDQVSREVSQLQLIHHQHPPSLQLHYSHHEVGMYLLLHSLTLLGLQRIC